MKKIIFGKINDSFFDVRFYTDEKPQCLDGFVVMKSERPIDGDYIANADGEWVIDNSELIKLNKERQQQLLNDANEKIVILQRAVKYNCATEDEKSLLEQLELFTIDIARVDVSNVDAVFPEMP